MYLYIYIYMYIYIYIHIHNILRYVFLCLYTDSFGQSLFMNCHSPHISCPVWRHMFSFVSQFDVFHNIKYWWLNSPFNQHRVSENYILPMIWLNASFVCFETIVDPWIGVPSIDAGIQYSLCRYVSPLSLLQDEWLIHMNHHSWW